MDVLRELVSVTNVYINTRSAKLNGTLLEYLAKWISRMLRVFGLGNDDESEIGWGQGEQDQGNVNVSLISSCWLTLRSCYRL
jgi:cysteinyl-tRNA synthetase